MKSHKYKAGKRVVIRHGACAGPMTGVITKLTWYPTKATQPIRATYTVKGDDGLIYPLLGIDKESEGGNICTKDTKAGHIIERSIDYEDIKQPSSDELKYKVHGISDLRELCKKRKLAKYGRKADLIDRLIIWDKRNENKS
jgi:hypothetical protein